MVFMKYDRSRFQISNTYEYKKTLANEKQKQLEGKKKAYKRRRMNKRNEKRKSGRNAKKDQTSIWLLRGTHTNRRLCDTFSITCSYFHLFAWSFFFSVCFFFYFTFSGSISVNYVKFKMDVEILGSPTLLCIE